MELLKQAQTADDKSQRGFGGWAMIVLAQLPLLAWLALAAWVFQVRAISLPQLPPDAIDRSIYYGLAIWVFELAYILLSGGYGVLSVPAAIIATVLLVKG